MINFYETLGVKPDASEKTILAAYHRLCNRRRPPAGDLDAVNLFDAFQAEIDNAFIWIADPEGRKQFDQILDNYNLALSLREDFKIEKVDGDIDITTGLRDAVNRLIRARVARLREPVKYLLRARAYLFKNRQEEKT
jgi:DnaJ-class molecular chaperone